MNHIQLTGRLVQDPELKALASGSSVCQLRLAVEGMAPGRETGYVNVSSFGAAGEAAARTLTKGWLVAVDGRLEQQSWEKDGQKRTGYAVIGNVEFLAAPRNSDRDLQAARETQAETDKEPERRSAPERAAAVAISGSRGPAGAQASAGVDW